MPPLHMPAVDMRAVQDNMGRFGGVSRSLDGGESWAACPGWTRDTPLGGVQPLRLAVAPRHAGSTQHFTATAEKSCLLIDTYSGYSGYGTGYAYVRIITSLGLCSKPGS